MIFAITFKTLVIPYSAQAEDLSWFKTVVSSGLKAGSKVAQSRSSPPAEIQIIIHLYLNGSTPTLCVCCIIFCINLRWPQHLKH